MSTTTEKRDEQKSEPGNAYALIRRAANVPAREWPDERIQAVRRYVDPDGDVFHNTHEIAVYIHSAQKYQLNPIMGEIFAFRSKGKIRVYAGRDGFVKAATRNPAYSGHESGVVYQKDEFRIEVRTDPNDPERRVYDIQHTIDGFDRGQIAGAYCIAYGKNGRATLVTRKFDDYKHLHSKFNWQNDPDGMIENRVISAALKRQNPLAGLWIEGEQGEFGKSGEEENLRSTTADRIQNLKSSLGIDQREEEGPEPEVIHAEIVTEDEPGGDSGDETNYDREAASLRKILRGLMARNDVPERALRAWAIQTVSVDDDPADWGEDELSFAVQTIQATHGKEVLSEYVRWLLAHDDTLGMEARLDEETEVANDPDHEWLLQKIEELEERVPIQELKP